MAKDVRKTGKVKWFNNAKGYGFIEPDDDSDDVFLHFGELREKNYALQEGDPLSYTPAPGPKGLQARDVELLDSEGKVLEAKLANFNNTLVDRIDEAMSAILGARNEVYVLASYVEEEQGMGEAAPYYRMARKLEKIRDKLGSKKPEED